VLFDGTTGGEGLWLLAKVRIGDETGLDVFKINGVAACGFTGVVVVEVVDVLLWPERVRWALLVGEPERCVTRGCLMTEVLLAAGTGVSLKGVEICGLLVLRDIAELLSDDGGDGVTGDALRTLPPAFFSPDGVTLNCDLIALKFRLVVTVFFVIEICTRPGDGVAEVVVGVFCSKIEIRSEIGVLPDCVNLAAILIINVSFFNFQI